MPLPRQRQKKRAANGTRASRRNIRDVAWLHAKITERFAELRAQLEDRARRTYRGAYGVIVYLKDGEPVPAGFQKVEYDENGRETPPYVKEKTPGLAAEGFSSVFHEKERLSG